LQIKVFRNELTVYRHIEERLRQQQKGIAMLCFSDALLVERRGTRSS
jgi:hypothetical protein